MNNNNNNQQVVYVTPAKSRAVYIIFGLFFGGLGMPETPGKASLRFLFQA